MNKDILKKYIKEEISNLLNESTVDDLKKKLHIQYKKFDELYGKLNLTDNAIEIEIIENKINDTRNEIVKLEYELNRALTRPY